MLEKDFKRKEKELLYSTKNIWLKYISKADRKKVFKFASEYMTFLDKCRTEREVIADIKKKLDSKKYKEAYLGKKIGNQSKYYLINRNKNIAIVRNGKKDLKDGINIIVSHIDCPRLDLKQNPLYEDIDIALFKTHYYGGIKKYQWLNIPLAIHGKIILKSGKEIDLSIGEDPADPVFVISDLLPHLSHKLHDSKKSKDFIKGEDLNLIVGSMPYEHKDLKNPVKFYILDLLNKEFGIVEKDFLSAEIEIVPALKTRHGGFDQSMILGYGHDDRSCSYAAFRALVDSIEPLRTSVVLFADKEEIGSDGTTGLKSKFFYDLIGEICANEKKQYSERDIRLLMYRSSAISADVNSVINPSFKTVHEKANASKLNHGIVLTKFTGSGGKYSSSDADAEFIYKLSSLFDKKKISWQIGEIGKIDEGGGGTVGKYIASWGMDVIDSGLGVMGMHSPYEIISKGDLYETYSAYKVFLKNFI
ncbi:MAG: aminopeptidase [Actinomycetia bacterium]|nr:aminopeptidase [Actinomycetes bacterium]